MGLISKEVLTKWNHMNKKWFEDKGYIFTKTRYEFKVRTEDLQINSHILVDVKCDCEDCKSPYLKPMTWQTFSKFVKTDGTYYCNKCSKTLYGGENARKAKLKKSKSIEQWCIENDRMDILDRWDYDLNLKYANEVNYRSSKKFYFKCGNKNHKHKSELKNFQSFSTSLGSVDCKQCNSFAQWCIDNVDKDFLELYWDYSKNLVNPWEISRGANINIFIKCQNKYKPYHEYYKTTCHTFLKGERCPYCNNRQVHILDSLGTLYPKALDIWSDKNIKTIYEYSPSSGQDVWWKCENNKHNDYMRGILSSNKICNFRCPLCQSSIGETKIQDYFIYNNIYYIPQKVFDGLLGLGNGSLSYDFYLPQINLLIEFQGIQHEKPIDFKGRGSKFAEEQFIIQQEHDKRKKEYAINNNIRLLEIWYWDIDNIENILLNNLSDI
jgi:hypothetical protein